MDKLEFKITRLRDNAIVPVYQTKHSAGADMHACIEEPITLMPMQRAAIPTGLSIEIPDGFEFQIRARSGLAIKNGISMINGIGTIDSDFRGEMHVLLINLGDKPFVIEPDMRIAQAVVAKYEHVSWREVDSLNETSRGKGGLGSTGV